MAKHPKKGVSKRAVSTALDQVQAGRKKREQSKRDSTAKVNAQSNLRKRQSSSQKSIRASDAAMKQRRANYDKYGY